MAFDANAAQALTLALTNLNATLAGGGRENKSVNYPTFSGRGDEDIDDFMSEMAKAFAVNRVPDNRKHIVAASCLKGTVANFYDSLAGITGWNLVGQLANTQLKLTLEVRFRSEAQATHYYNQYLALKQGTTQTVDSYANRFLELRSKIDPNNNTPVAHVVLKFVQGLLPQLMTITYASNPGDVQQAIDTAKRLEGGLSLATQ